MRLPLTSMIPLLTLAVLFVPVDGTAQVSLGLSAGAAFTRFSGDDFKEPMNTEFFDEIRTKTGFVAGGYLAFPLGGLISIAPGVYYVQKGIEAVSSEVDVNEDSLRIVAELNYIEIPLLAVLNITGDRPVGVSLFLGPTVAFEIACEAGVVQGLFSSQGDCGSEEDFVDEDGLPVGLDKTDFGAIFGAGLSFPLGGPVDFTVNGGLDMGLKKLKDIRPADILGVPAETRVGEFKNSSWFVTGGVRFPLGG